MTAPTMAASNKNEAISNGNKIGEKHLSHGLCGAEVIGGIADFNKRGLDHRHLRHDYKKGADDRNTAELIKTFRRAVSPSFS